MNTSIKHSYFRVLFFYVMIAVLAITSFSCNYFRNVKLLTGGSIERKNFEQTIPFEYIKGLIVVEGLVNEDEVSRQFIFDTGAFNSKIEYDLADSLELKTFATKENSTAAGVSQQIEVTKLNSLTLGDVVFKNIGAGKLKYNAQSASPCVADDGLIGANLIKLAHWKIDYQNRELSFSDSHFSSESMDAGEPIKFKRPLLSAVPEIELGVGGRTVKGVLFDVGYNGGLILPAKFADAFESEIQSKVYDRSTTGIYGSNTDTLIIKQLEIDLGGHTFTTSVEFSSIGKALLGNDILEHFEVLINNKKKEITLAQISEVEVPESYSFIPGVLNDSLWVVNRTSDELPFSLGDTLTSINGKTPADYFATHCDYVMGIGALLEQDLQVELADGDLVEIGF